MGMVYMMSISRTSRMMMVMLNVTKMMVVMVVVVLWEWCR